jgi:hypothetical protein
MMWPIGSSMWRNDMRGVGGDALGAALPVSDRDELEVKLEA